MPPKKTKKTTAKQTKEELSIEQALQRIAELEARLADESEDVQPSKVETVPKEDLKRMASLEAALIASRRQATAARTLAETASQEAVYEVTNLVGATISINVTDARGNPKNVMFPMKGSTAFLTASQILEAHDRYPAIFNDGFLSAPEVLPDSDNAILDYDKFVDELEIDGIDARIAAIDSVDVLMSLFHYIENKRFATEDEDGKPYRNANGVQELREVTLTPKVRMLSHAVASRVRDLSSTEEEVGTDNEGNPIRIKKHVVLTLDGSGE